MLVEIMILMFTTLSFFVFKFVHTYIETEKQIRFWSEGVWVSRMANISNYNFATDDAYRNLVPFVKNISLICGHMCFHLFNGSIDEST